MAIDPLEGFKTDGAIEDTSAVFGSYPAPDEPLFLSALPLFTPPTFDNANDLSHDFFSHTPLGWVQPGNETQIQSAETRTGPSPLTRDSRIRELTTQPAQQPFQPSSSPETTRNKKRKRKKSMADKSDDFSSPDLMSDTVKRSGRKTAHNMIEKRYRTNLNQKIAALRDAVPSLRATTKNSKGEDVLQEDLQGLAPAHKLNKATILMKATEYIRHLEQRNKVLSQENAALKSRIDAFEIMVLARQGQNTKQSAALKLQQTRMW